MISAQVSKYIGAKVKRKEDPRLITGQGKYTDDVNLKGMCYLYILRSMHAHALIKNIDTTEAEKLPGIIKIFTGKEINKKCPSPMPLVAPIDDMKWEDRQPMAENKTCFVGEPIALVIGQSREEAKDALDLISVDYEPLDAVVDLEKEIKNPSAPMHTSLGTNIAYHATGNSGNPKKAFRTADNELDLRLEQPRLVPNPMEPRAAVAAFDSANRNLTIWSTTQNPHIERDNIAKVLGFPVSKLRLIAIDVGGGFGCKINTYPEPILAALASMEIEKPVKWTEERQENFISTSHGRGQVQFVKAAFNNDGTLVGLKLKILADLGAYCQVLSHAIPTLTPSLAPGVYKIRDMEWETYGIYTNKVPYDAYRGAGRPEGAYIIERVMDCISAKTDIDPAEVRRRNFIPPSAFPYKTPTDMEYDSGEYEKALNKVIELSKYHQLKEEQKHAKQKGKLMGIGITTTTEVCGFGPADSLGGLGGYESATVRINPDGEVTVLTGTSPHGQGEETSFAQITADLLGIEPDNIEIIHGDTDIVPRGVGTLCSRSIAVGGTAIVKASEKVIAKAKDIAGALFKIDPKFVIFKNGVFSVEDIPGKTLTWKEIGSEAYDGQLLPDNVERGLEGTTFWEPPGLTFPFSAHVAVIDIDKETGEVSLRNYFAVDDCGNVINPTLVEGQVHGGLAQGIGQALLEEAIWDNNGQLITGSFMDYPMPFAKEFPLFTLDRTITPTSINPLGAKGIGEMATIASTPTIANAVINALSHLGVEHIDIPLRSQKIWEILKEKGVIK